MKRRTRTYVILLAAIIGLSAKSEATVLDFEDLVGAGAVPADYHGLTWENWLYYDDPQPPYFPSSGVQRVYNDRPLIASLKFGADVTFNGLWLAGIGHDQYVEGYDNGVKVFESAPHMPSDGSDFGAFLNLDWAGVDEIRIESNESNHNFWIADDITYNATTVPDSGSSVLLMASALSGLALLRRRLS